MRSPTRWTILVVLCVGQLMIVLDATVVNVALPVIELRAALLPSLVGVGGQCLLSHLRRPSEPLAGRIGDLVGRTRWFLRPELLCRGFGHLWLGPERIGPPWRPALCRARPLRWSLPWCSASWLSMFPEPRERTHRPEHICVCRHRRGPRSVSSSEASSRNSLSWHWIFFINVPVGLAALIVGVRLIPRHPGLGWRSGADFVGAVLVTGAPSAAVYGLIQAGDAGWTAPSTIGPLVGSVGLGLAFFLVESRVQTPLIPLHVLRRRSLASSAVVRSLLLPGFRSPSWGRCTCSTCCTARR